MKHKQILSLALVLALLLGCVGYTPVRTAQDAQAENAEPTQAAQDIPS